MTPPPLPATPADLLATTAARTPDTVALVDAGDRWTWARLDDAVTRAAAALRSRTEPGDRVSVELPTGAGFVVAYLGVLRAGCVAVPVDPSYTPREVDHILEDSGAGVRISADAIGELLAAPAAERPDVSRNGNDLAALLYTSGTSGRGKGAMLTGGALLADVEQLLALDPPLLRPDDVVFLPVPLSHILGLNAGLATALRAGARIVLADVFDPAGSLATMAEEQVTVVLATPGHYAAWAGTDAFPAAFGTVRFAMSGSTRLGRGLVETYSEAGVPLYDGYGLTEAAPVVALSTPADAPLAAAGSVGRPLPGVEVVLRDALPRGEAEGPVADGDPGRIHVRGPNLFSGYWPDGRDGPDADGWFATGDIAVADADGRLRIVGRTTDLVIVSGFNVYPAEVETVLMSLPGVAEAAVVGVPDERTGEAVHAFVVPAPGARLDPDGLRTRASASLARFKVPASIEVVPGLPHTVTGKVQKWQLRQEAIDGTQ
ncbi:acyl-CoA synthetase family protein [Jatrophihabitans fulvus]